MESHLIIFISQLVLGFVRNLNTRYVSRGNVLYSLITGAAVKISILASSFIGITSLMDGDYWIAITFVISGIMGDYLSFKIKI